MPYPEPEAEYRAFHLSHCLMEIRLPNAKVCTKHVTKVVT